MPYEQITEVDDVAEQLVQQARELHASHPLKRRAITLGLIIAGVLGCAFSAQWAFASRPTLQSGSGSWDVIEEFNLSGQEPAFITWKKHPEKCWGLPKLEMKNSMKLHIWDCEDRRDRFFIPAGGTGVIRSARYPEYCLDAPGSSTVIQWFLCADAPEKNLQWKVPENGSGDILPASWEGQCVDVPGGKVDAGQVLQQWKCSPDISENEGFVIHRPADCRWEAWSEWTSCPDTCGAKKSRERKSRVDSGEECAGHEVVEKHCGNSKDCEHLESGPEDAHLHKGGSQMLFQAPRWLLLALCTFLVSGYATN